MQSSPHFLICDLKMAVPEIHVIYNTVAVVIATLNKVTRTHPRSLPTEQCTPWPSEAEHFWSSAGSAVGEGYRILKRCSFVGGSMSPGAGLDG